jgi:subtilisin family serine protease
MTPARPTRSASPAAGTRSRRVSAAAALGAALLGLAGCGGGGDTAAPSAPAPAPTPAPAPGANREIPGELLVMFAPTTGEAGAAAVAAERGLVRVSRFGNRPIYRYRLPAGASANTVLAALRADPRVRLAEANVETETPEGRYAVPWAFGNGDGSVATPWAATALRLPQAQALAQGSGVRVAVLDSGFDLEHPGLAPRLARRADGSLLGRDFVDDDTDPADTARPTDAGYGHGTHVAGIVAQTAPGARLMPLRVLDNAGRGNLWVLAEALLWAIDPDGDPATDDGAHVINISLGTTQRSRILDTVVEVASCELGDDDDEFDDRGFDGDKQRCTERRGAVVAAAAGNAGSDQERQYPAAERVRGLVAVTAIAADGRLASFANSGSWVQLAAPGAAISSSFPGGRAATWNGTSMATPWVAGAAALLLSTPGPDAAEGVPLPRSWTPEAVAKRLLDRSRPGCGTGIPALDAAAALTDTSAPPAC